MKRKRILALLLAMALMAPLAACGAAGSPDQSSAQASTSESSQAPTQSASDKSGAITLQFWNGLTGPDGPVLQDYVNEFNQSNKDGITISMNIIPWANFMQKLPQSIATGTAPDFVIMVGDMLGLYTSNGSYQPMDDYFTLGNTPKDKFTAESLALFNLDGVQWSLPQALYGPAYYYWNKDLFKKAGLDPEKPPETYDQIIEAAKKLTDPKTGTYGLGLPIQDNRLINQMILSETGYTYFDETTKKGNMEKPEVQALLTKLQSVIKTNKISPPSVSGAEMDHLALTGQLAQYMNGPWMLDGFRQSGLNFGVKSIPSGAKGPVGTVEGAGFAVLKDTSEANKKAVYKFLDFYYSDEKAVDWALKNGNPPFLKPVIENDKIKSDPYASEFVKSMQYGKPHFVGYKTMPQITSDVLNPLFENVFYGGANVATATKDADAAMEKILAQETR